mmetsp:Transcript_44930/g.83331  ORF Transcript_44930/g.83331 Transcript_44930/m.83331 type:complete len:201 (-) Transcript_44930:776-1378(-)
MMMSTSASGTSRRGTLLTSLACMLGTLAATAFAIRVAADGSSGNCCCTEGGCCAVARPSFRWCCACRGGEVEGGACLLRGRKSPLETSLVGATDFSGWVVELAKERGLSAELVFVSFLDELALADDELAGVAVLCRSCCLGVAGARSSLDSFLMGSARPLLLGFVALVVGVGVAVFSAAAATATATVCCLECFDFRACWC